MSDVLYTLDVKVSIGSSVYQLVELSELQLMVTQHALTYGSYSESNDAYSQMRLDRRTDIRSQSSAAQAEGLPEPNHLVGHHGDQPNPTPEYCVQQCVSHLHQRWWARSAMAHPTSGNVAQVQVAVCQRGQCIYQAAFRFKPLILPDYERVREALPQVA